MQTTSEILTALAPEFVELDEAEKSAFPAPWEWNNYQRAFYRCTPGRMQLASLVTYNENTKFVQAARNQTRALLDAYAQALAKLEALTEWEVQ